MNRVDLEINVVWRDLNGMLNAWKFIFAYSFLFNYTMKSRLLPQVRKYDLFVARTQLLMISYHRGLE